MGEGGGKLSGIVNPSVGIIKSWQGILELSLRTAIIVLGLLMIAGGGSCQASASELPSDAVAIQPLTASAGGWLMFLGFIIVIYEIIFVVQRFLNVAIVNENITIVLLIDMIASFVVAFFIFCGAVALAAYVPQWAALLVTSDPFFRGIIQRVVTASGAAAAFGFLTMFVLIGHGVFILLGGLIFKWGATRGKYEVSGGGGGGGGE